MREHAVGVGLSSELVPAIEIIGLTRVQQARNPFKLKQQSRCRNLQNLTLNRALNTLTQNQTVPYPFPQCPHEQWRSNPAVGMS